MEPPSGHVTIVFTDIEDSTRMTTALGAAYLDELLPQHNERVRKAAEGHHGYVVKTLGDSFMMAFPQAADAVACAIDLQKAMAESLLTVTDQSKKTWTLKVRIGVHRALEPLTPQPSPECKADYHGPDVNFAKRVESLGAGGQIVVSDSAYQAVEFAVPGPWKAWPHRRIRSFDRPETVWECLWDGQSRGEPGARFLPHWFKGEHNRYIPRPELERRVLAHFGKLLPDGSVPRLVTLHAFGGMGKTRLAIACAIQAVGMFKDGVFFVWLDDQPPSEAAVAEAMGAALNLAQEARRPDKLLDHLSGKEALLLLDNYESVDSDAVQGFLIELLKRTSDVRLLVTGREAVKLSDVEQEISLDDGLTDDEAHELFLARARLKKGQQWQPTRTEAESIRRIVVLSERIPLAIELAAAWVNHSSVNEIAAGLEATPLGGASKEPGRSARLDQATRHRSLIRSLDYSHERLEPWAQEGFARLGVFAESFTAETVMGACGLPNAGDLLFRLQDASLIRRLEADGRSRYTMLRPTRAYAVEKLGALPEKDSLRQGFIRYLRETAKRKQPLAARTADTATKVPALDWFEEEWPNLLAAARLALDDEEWKAVCEISSAVFEFWQIRGHRSEVEELYGLALSASRRGNDRFEEGRTLNTLGVVYQEQGRWDEAIQVYQQSLAICREFNDHLSEGQALINLGNVYKGQGRWVEAIEAYQQSLAISREFKDHVSEGYALNNLGMVYESQGDWGEAIANLQQSLAILREFKDRVREGNVLNNLGNVYYLQGRWDEALKAYQQGLAIKREFKNRDGEGQTLNNLGIVYQSQGRWEEAIEAYQQSLGICRELKDRRGEGRTLFNLALLKKEEKDIPVAREYARAAVAAFEQTEDKATLQKARGLLGLLK